MNRYEFHRKQAVADVLHRCYDYYSWLQVVVDAIISRRGPDRGTHYLRALIAGHLFPSERCASCRARNLFFSSRPLNRCQHSI